jgi:hypothetical protein
MLQAFGEVIPAVTARGDGGGARVPARFNGRDIARAMPAEMQDALSGAVLAQFGARLGRLRLECRVA